MSTAVPVDLRRTFKMFVLFENVKLLHSSFILGFFFVMDFHFETHNANVITG